ncbi:MAG: tRNA adenosine(34) deaminase TadA [Propionibacteriaceae bacterium]|jgi:tRNA(adenine34) deaminase|nr:tRNA adenosine(34) deaminase TadA [Propionibacteriaceae bacterium]
MRLALAQAEAAAVRGEVPVGAVVLHASGAVLAAAGNERESTNDVTGHAEIAAMRQAAAKLGGWRLDGCTLVVTLEPCAMCAGALVQARIAKLVLGAWDEKAGAVSSLWDVVRDPRLNHRVEVVSGVLAAEASALLSDFFASRRSIHPQPISSS